MAEDETGKMVQPELDKQEEWRQSAYQSALLPDGPLAPEAYQSAIVPADLPAELQATAEPSAEPPPLSEQTKLGLGMLAVALVAGLGGDVLLRATPWGINLLLWLALTSGAVLALCRWQKSLSIAVNPWLLGVLCFGATALAWRASPVLRGLDLFGMLVALSMIGLRTHTGRLASAELSGYLKAGLRTVGGAAVGTMFLLFDDIRWRELPRDGWSKRALAIGRGLGLAAPLLLLFGTLLMAADAVFEDLVKSLFRFDAARLFLHGATIGGIGWLVAGYLRTLHPKPMFESETLTQPKPPTLGMVELSIVLGLLDLLFLAFVSVQFKYLFFGAAHFPPGAGLAYALYARRGFFELVTVATLVLPLLLGADWLRRKDEPRNEKIFRALAGAQIALLFVMMASAIYRMRLYQLCCGLTELRVYTMAFMGWLAVVLGWFVLTVLRGRRERFAIGATVTILALIGALHFLDPDDLIARVNVERARAGAPFNANYAASLSADAVPALAAGLAHLNEAERQVILQRWQARQAEWAVNDWRSWNWSRARATRLVQQQLEGGRR
jgi:hypothetical protein